MGGTTFSNNIHGPNKYIYIPESLVTFIFRVLPEHTEYSDDKVSEMQESDFRN